MYPEGNRMTVAPMVGVDFAAPTVVVRAMLTTDRAIDTAKQRNITRAARSYATKAGIPWNKVRFDTVSVVFTEPPSIVHHQDAFFEGRAN